MTRSYKTIHNHLPNTEYWKKRLLLMPSGYQVDRGDVYKICEILEYCQQNYKDILEQI